MSDLEADGGGPRRRRADAERNIERIVEAAIRVLGVRPDATIGDIAKAAGVTRPTVYAHFSSREEVVAAAVDRVTEDAVAAMDAAELDTGPPVAALQRYLSVGWHTLERYPMLLRTAPLPEVPELEEARHEPIRQRLERLVERGQESGDFDRTIPPSWLAAVTIALGHTTGEQVAAEAMTTEEAADVLAKSVLRLYGVTPAPG